MNSQKMNKCQICKHDGTVYSLTWMTGDESTLICSRCYKLIWNIVEEVAEKIIYPVFRTEWKKNDD